MVSNLYPDKFSKIGNSSLSYQFAVFLCRLLFTGFYKTEVSGIENIPRNRGFILACNHQSFLDPPMVGCFLNRPIAYFARDTLFKKGFVSWFLKQLYTIPVRRDAPSDVNAIKTVLKILKQSNRLNNEDTMCKVPFRTACALFLKFFFRCCQNFICQLTEK